jgi:hypothetical protein
LLNFASDIITGSVEDPDPGAGFRRYFDPWIRDGKKILMMYIPDYFSESLERIFNVKNTHLLWCGSRSGIRAPESF